MEQHRNERAGKTEDPRENQLTRPTFRHYSYERKSGSSPAGDRIRWKASSLTTTPQRPPVTFLLLQVAYARLHHRGSKLDPRSKDKTVAPFELRAGLEIEMNHRNWRFEISIGDQQPSSTNIDESEIHNHEISLVQHFYVGTKIKWDPISELGSFDLGSGRMLAQPGIRRIEKFTSRLQKAHNVRDWFANNLVESKTLFIRSCKNKLVRVLAQKLFAIGHDARLTRDLNPAPLTLQVEPSTSSAAKVG
ncbi:hypothetical protein PR048_033337 [Dryococelus australis]|uniref:Uncharacterized protein n=1 Tax=Dryococelus australis TaxID=614101 RepID=A0ABQ9G006_9NEOP|nr:hypothetical protein PR048_033337 [Dryococelus australis]